MIRMICNHSQYASKRYIESGKRSCRAYLSSVRNTDPPDEETARGIIERLFFSDKRYDLGEVGRYRINKKLNLDTFNDTRVLTNEDIILIIKYLIELSQLKN